MHIGIMSGHFRRPSLAESLDAILGHGIRHLQFNLGSAHLDGPPGEQDESVFAGIREEVDRRGMTIAALGGPVNMVHPDPVKRQEGIDQDGDLDPNLWAFGDLGDRHVHRVPGIPRACGATIPTTSPKTLGTCSRARLEHLLPIAESHGVALAFEPEVNNVCNNAKRSRQLIDEMASSALKVVMDASNLFGKGELPRMTEILDEAFDLLGEHVSIAHAKDLDHDGDAGHLPAGAGKLDYERYVSLLCALPFEVSVILHGLGEDQVADSVAMLDRCAATVMARPAE